MDARPVDVAIDFADMRTFIDRIQAAFFASGLSESPDEGPGMSPTGPTDSTDD